MLARPRRCGLLLPGSVIVFTVQRPLRAATPTADRERSQVHGQAKAADRVRAEVTV